MGTGSTTSAGGYVDFIRYDTPVSTVMSDLGGVEDYMVYSYTYIYIYIL